MSALSNAHRTADATLNLTHVHDAVHSDHLEHAVVVVRLRELVVLLRAPGISTGSPTEVVVAKVKRWSS